MSEASEDGGKDAQGNNLYAALARTFTRSAALYFSRPVRLFRPSKISGWHSLKGIATLEGTSLSPTFVSQLVKSQGIMVIPKHFFPPLMVNAALGTVLWASYAEASTALEPYLGTSPIMLAAGSGAVAGGCQALVAAPVENVRHAIERGTMTGGGWTHAWREVFRGPLATSSPLTKRDKKEELRQFRAWSQEVRDMAGRGWEGWGWGIAKDVSGFAVFFAIFEATRRFAGSMRLLSQSAYQYLGLDTDDERRFRRHFPRVVHGLTLVSGGVVAGLAYEVLSRPWDAARRVVYLDRVRTRANHEPKHFALTAVIEKARDDGVLSFFRDASSPSTETAPPRRRMLYNTLRIVGRAGPWGIGFLVWEAFGPGIA